MVEDESTIKTNNDSCSYIDKYFGSEDQSEYHVWRSAQYVKNMGISTMREITHALEIGKNLPVLTLVNLVKDLVTSCRKDEPRFVALARLKDSEHYLYSHPLNVCIYSIAMGNQLKYSFDQLVRLGEAALLHDIGQIKMPSRMFNKASTYTQSEMLTIRKHPELGYELLKNEPSLNNDVLMGILHHHERIDGSGYPSGHIGRFIHPFGKIIAVAEAFDAMTTNRSNANSITLHEGLRRIYALAGKHYDTDIVKIFISLLGMYPVGSLVRLSDNHIGVVYAKNDNDLTKPKVVVIINEAGEKIEPYILDLLSDEANGRTVTSDENSNYFHINPYTAVENFLKAKPDAGDAWAKQFESPFSASGKIGELSFMYPKQFKLSEVPMGISLLSEAVSGQMGQGSVEVHNKETVAELLVEKQGGSALTEISMNGHTAYASTSVKDKQTVRSYIVILKDSAQKPLYIVFRWKTENQVDYTSMLDKIVATIN